jgi:hypothetical protein
MDNRSIANDTECSLVENARWNEMKGKRVAFGVVDGVSSICPTLVNDTVETQIMQIKLRRFFCRIGFMTKSFSKEFGTILKKLSLSGISPSHGIQTEKRSSHTDQQNPFSPLHRDLRSPCES